MGYVAFTEEQFHALDQKLTDIAQGGGGEDSSIKFVVLEYGSSSGSGFYPITNMTKSEYDAIRSVALQDTEHKYVVIMVSTSYNTALVAGHLLTANSVTAYEFSVLANTLYVASYTTTVKDGTFGLTMTTKRASLT